MFRTLLTVIVGCLAVYGSGPATAGGIFGVPFNVVETNLPVNMSIVEGDFEDNGKAFIFKERDDFDLAAPLPVDITEPGDYGPAPAIQPTIGPGVHFESWLLHFDPVGQSNSTTSIEGNVTFDNRIVGLIVTFATLNATDAFPGASVSENVTYSGDLNRGLELDNDVIKLSDDRLTLSFNTLIASFGAIDQIRIITIPEPSTLSLAGLGLIGLVCGAARRSQRRRRVLLAQGQED